MEASVPMELRCIALQYMDVFVNLESLLTPCHCNLMEASLCRHDQLLTSFPSLSLWDGSGAGVGSRLVAGLKMPSF